MNGKPPIRFIVEGKPKTPLNKIRRVGSRVFVTAKASGTEWQSFASLKASGAMRGNPPLTGAIRTDITIFRMIPKGFSKKKHNQALSGDLFPVTRPDYDNCTKQLNDAMNGIIYNDDSQIVTAVVKKRYATSHFIEVEVWEIGFND